MENKERAINVRALAKNSPLAKLEINFDELQGKVADVGLTLEKLSIETGFSKAWLSNIKNRNGTIPASVVVKIAETLNCNADDLAIENAEKPAKEITEIEDIADIEPSEFEVNVLDVLKEIKLHLTAQKEILMYLFNEKQKKENEALKKAEQAEKEEAKENPKDELKIACETLESILANRMGVKMADYLQSAKEAGVTNEKVADAAIAKTGYHKKTTGYGNNKTLWIYKPIEL